MFCWVSPTYHYPRSWGWFVLQPPPILPHSIVFLSERLVLLQPPPILPHSFFCEKRMGEVPVADNFVVALALFLF
jgi:hypothetical protein